MGSLPRIVEDCFGILRLYSDGSVQRADTIDFGSDYSAAQEDGSSVAWKDCLFDKRYDLHLRLYKPTGASAGDKLLPIVYYFHGGGFCVGSRTWPNCHNCCLRLCSRLQAFVVAPDYRLAPEHRLPAALEDGLNAVKWLQLQAQKADAPPSTNIDLDQDEWLTSDQGADFDRLFIIGDSSGGNIAHHLAVELESGSPALAPLKVRGYVLLAPFFGGATRTKSEAEGPPEQHLNLDVLDRFWRLSLPVGESRDHPLANPFGPNDKNSGAMEKLSLDTILVIVGSEEIMRDRVRDYATRLKDLGKRIQYVEVKGQQHGFFSHNPYSDAADELLHLLKQFISSNSQYQFPI